jgi:hypothetical protein
MKNGTLRAFLAVAIGLGATAHLAAQAPKPAPPAPGKVPIMAVHGCLTQEGTNWFLTSATEPVASTAGADPAPPTGPTTGKGRFQLVGITEFNLPSMKDHSVTVKGLFVKASPVSRLNLTSVKSLAPSCARAK